MILTIPEPPPQLLSAPVIPERTVTMNVRVSKHEIRVIEILMGVVAREFVCHIVAVFVDISHELFRFVRNYHFGMGRQVCTSTIMPFGKISSTLACRWAMPCSWV